MDESLAIHGMAVDPGMNWPQKTESRIGPIKNNTVKYGTPPKTNMEH